VDEGIAILQPETSKWPVSANLSIVYAANCFTCDAERLRNQSPVTRERVDESRGMAAGRNSQGWDGSEISGPRLRSGLVQGICIVENATGDAFEH
jgi:hypothetical protein